MWVPKLFFVPSRLSQQLHWKCQSAVISDLVRDKLLFQLLSLARKKVTVHFSFPQRIYNSCLGNRKLVPVSANVHNNDYTWEGLTERVSEWVSDRLVKSDGSTRQCARIWTDNPQLPIKRDRHGNAHKGAITQVKLIATALARCKGVDEGEATGQLFGRLSLILSKANALMLSSRCQDSDFPSPAIDGIE